VRHLGDTVLLLLGLFPGRSDIKDHGIKRSSLLLLFNRHCTLLVLLLVLLESLASKSPRREEVVDLLLPIRDDVGQVLLLVVVLDSVDIVDASCCTP